MLRPLRTMNTAIKRISARNVHERLALRGPRDELRNLADTVDGLLERLDSAFDAQKRFVAKAAYELRMEETPGTRPRSKSTRPVAPCALLELDRRPVAET